MNLFVNLESINIIFFDISFPFNIDFFNGNEHKKKN
jgi:hypothetical protein